MRHATFFTMELVGPMPPDHYRHVVASRWGQWNIESLQGIARRAGLALTEAYVMTKDSKGFITASKRSLLCAAPNQA